MKKFTLIFTSLLVAFSLSASTSEPVEKSKDGNAKVSENKEVIIDNAVVTDAMREFKSLSRVDRKMRIAQAKAALKEFKAQKKAARASSSMAEPSTNTVLLVILAILLPPLAVALHEHGINGKFWLSLLLTLLFFLPGVIYALLVVLGSA